MADILLRGLAKWTVDRLKRRAKRNGRSLQSELKTLLEREARAQSIDEAIERAREIRASMPPAVESGPDSVELIREDRQR